MKLLNNHFLFWTIFSLCNINCFVINANENNKNTGSFKKFINKYVLPDENQIFGKKMHQISVFAGYDSGKLNAKWLKTKSMYDVAIYSGHYYEDIIRHNGEIAVNYSLPTKFWWFNGRFTLGLFTWLMHQNINNYSGESIVYNILNKYSYGDYNGSVEGWFMNHTLGFELIQELIFGHPNLYLTIGLGVSYQIVVGTSNLKTNNAYFDDDFYYRKPKMLWNNSNFNFVIKASVGHRFNNGLIIEATWKHYSNGNLSEYNWGLNFIGGTIGYVF